MSIFEEKQPMVTICKVKKILKHPNADRLEIAEIKGWQVVCQKDIYKEGDLVIYFEIDSVLPEDVENIIFGKDAKIKLSKSRVKTIRIRQMYSQGLICPIVLLQERITKKIKEGIDISDDLGVKKYEEPISKSSKMYVQPIKKKYENPNFHKVRKPQNIKNFKDLFIGKEVSVTEKVHGCFEGNMKVLLANGEFKKIKEIVDNNLDVEVLTYDHINKKTTKSKILNKFINGKVDNWYDVKICNIGSGRNSSRKYFNIKCTKNHKFFVVNKNEYKEICDCCAGDKFLHSLSVKVPSNFQKSVMIGILLGDGSLGNNNIQFSHKKGHEKYIDHIIKYLGNYTNGYKKDYISGYGSNVVRSLTIQNHWIGNSFSSWFVSGKKEVPDDIVIDPISMAFLYMDQGSLSHTERQQDRALLAICNFSERSVDNLLNAFKRDLGLCGVKYFSENKYWRIRFNKDDADKLFKIIMPYMCECMMYKLPEYYRNFNEFYKPNEHEIKYTMGFIESVHEFISIEKQIDMSKVSKKKYDIETEQHNYFINGILVHNSSFIAGYIKRPKATLTDKINIFVFGEYEFCYRSMSVQLQKRKSVFEGAWRKILNKQDAGFYEKEIGKDVYSEAVKNYKLKDIIDKGYEITCEIYGDGIQKNYSYSLKPGERKLICYGVRKDGINVPFKEAKQYCEKIGIPYVPILHVGILTEDVLNNCTNGKSTLDGKTIREGCVVELTNQENSSINILKSISEAYLLKNENGTDFH